MTFWSMIQLWFLLVSAACAALRSSARLLSEQTVDSLFAAREKGAGSLRSLERMPGGIDGAVQLLFAVNVLFSGGCAALGLVRPAAAALAAALKSWPAWLLFFLPLALCLLLLGLLHVFAYRLAAAFALRDGQKTALALARPLGLLCTLLLPLIRLCQYASNTVLKAAGVEAGGAEATEDGIRMMAESGSLHGAIDSQENEFIQNVFEFNDVAVEEICTHRTDAVCLYEDEDDAAWEATIFENRHSYFVVCGEDTDDIVGVLDAKTYIRMPVRSKAMAWEKCIQKPYLVPESMKAATLFANMKKTGNFFAVAIDEYGGMAGIVTMRDLLELIVGEWTEKDEQAQPALIEAAGEDTWRIRGIAPLDDVAEALGTALPTREYDTFGGFVFGELGYVPEDGSTVTLDYEGLAIQVTRIEDHRIEEAIVTKPADTGEGERSEEKEN